jgi:hypothetical protein
MKEVDLKCCTSSEPAAVEGEKDVNVFSCDASSETLGSVERIQTKKLEGAGQDKR